MKVSERGFEDAITGSLVAHGGYRVCKWGTKPEWAADFDRVRGLDTAELFGFIEETQPKDWERLVAVHAGQDGARQQFADRLAKQLDERGTVDVLRHGVNDHGIEVRLAFFKPAHGLTPELTERYLANHLTVTRQLPFDAAATKTIDLCLFVNGIPVATAELKNPLTHQTVQDAKRQYRTERDPANVTLGRRALVHFVADPEFVEMTTCLAGPKTRFLPFNRGNAGGKGNPPDATGHRTRYLWEQVWAHDAWLDLLGRFIHITPGDGATHAAQLRNGTAIFPRYHQWDAVCRLEAAAREEGPGQSYLVQHSAGSGKSNTIAWLAHRLMSLHGADDRPVFDKVVVITDRVILDRQLQETIYQFEHATGVVARIDQDSAQLGKALEGEQARIVITTLQKFPFILDKVKDLGKRRFAVIVDEAHSSQTGEAAKDLKAALGSASAEAQLALAEQAEATDAPIDPQDALSATVAARGRQPNLSFFAFTATPKARTLELFGRKNADGNWAPFHLYSMRQAIEEGFILDVLANYTTYATYWKVGKAVADDPEYDTRKARRSIARFVSLHPHNLAQKAEIIVEHFREHTRHKIGGKGKAMVVTSSRLHAVRYKGAIDRYIAEHGYADMKTLVAFSGRVDDGGLDCAFRRNGPLSSR
jgi:type I restriction enzyme R subunit